MNVEGKKTERNACGSGNKTAITIHRTNTNGENQP